MSKKLPHFLLFTTILVWGSSFPVMSFLLNIVEPMPLALCRFLIPGVMSLIFLIFSTKTIDKQDIIRFVLAGFIGIFFYKSNKFIFLPGTTCYFSCPKSEVRNPKSESEVRHRSPNLGPAESTDIPNNCSFYFCGRQVAASRAAKKKRAEALLIRTSPNSPRII